VASIAKRLIGAASAGAPEVGFSCFDGDGIRAFLGDDWIGHEEISSQENKIVLNRTISE
jgi:hypothetical protein